MKLKKCNHCKKYLSVKAFYCETAPYCKACNSEAQRAKLYRSEAKRDPAGFARKIQAKETQLNGMIQALSEARE